MAAPPSKTIRDLNGTWVMNKTLSNSPDEALKLQGVNWLTRKTINIATVTITVKQYQEAGVSHIDIQQTATGGIKGTSEERALDNEWREHSDWLFGKVRGRTEWVSAPAADAFLASNWEAGSKEWLHSYVESLDNGWTAEQIWGFQVVNGERRHARNVLVKKGDNKVELRMIYDFQG